MKWLILLALVISCGKHQEPEAKDYRDSDGDGLINEKEESALDKYTANYESLGQVNGTLRFKINDTFAIDFGNGENLDSKITGVIVSKEKRLKQEEHFSEWSKLKVKKPVQLPKMANLEYEVVIEFEKNMSELKDLYFESKKFSSHLGKWNQKMSFKLSADNLRLLVNGEAYMVLRKKFRKSFILEKDTEEIIREKTNRVLLNDGKSSTVYYIAKEVDLKGIAKLLDLSLHEIKTEDDFFFNSAKIMGKQWIGREFSNGDKVLLLTDFEKLKKRFFENYTVKKTIIDRVNGYTGKSLSFANMKDANVYLKVKPVVHTENVFQDRKVERSYGEGGGGREGNASSKIHCKHYFKNIVDQRPLALPTIETLVANNDLMQNDAYFSDALKQQGEGFDYWELKLTGIPENSIFKLNETSAHTKVKIGELSKQCGDSKGETEIVDLEGKLRFEVESFVEKIP